MARLEIERRLASSSSSSALLAYPHFVGTVTSFLDRFIALPYIRGLGWRVNRIDDDVFAESAKKQIPSIGALRSLAQRQPQSVVDWVTKLELSPSFNCPQPGVIPGRLDVKRKHRQPGPQSASGVALEQLKAFMVGRGIFRYGDMSAIANQALDKCPALSAAIRKRFPLVILDEAQDTNGDLLSLLRRLFENTDQVAFQSLGDQNQTLYENQELTPADYWNPGDAVIPLDETRRFGVGIAEFASRLTVRRSQQIVGLQGIDDCRCIIAFDRNTIQAVVPEYVRQLKLYFGEAGATGVDSWVLASRHNLYRDRRGNWPKSLTDYFPNYRGGPVNGEPADVLCATMRKIATLFGSGGSTADIWRLMTEALLGLLVAINYRPPTGQLSAGIVWRIMTTQGVDRSLKRVFYENILKGRAPWDEAEWATFVRRFSDVLGIAIEIDDQGRPELEALKFTNEGAVAEQRQRDAASASNVIEGVPLRYGSIHSVKGCTKDAVLVVETEVFRGSAADQRVMDIATVLPHALGVENRDFTQNEAELAAATNIFVASTRPRRFLGLALRKEALSEPLAEAAARRGWTISDLT